MHHINMQLLATSAFLSSRRDIRNTIFNLLLAFFKLKDADWPIDGKMQKLVWSNLGLVFEKANQMHT